MTWQKLIGHINGSKVMVRSKSGNEYGAETEYDYINRAAYSQLTNDAHDDVDFWAWVDFSDGSPVVEEFTRGDMPTSPPWVQD